ncbi:hypothetical protein CRG98_034387 [Punica granatum]|uniref:Uncharacterized protein n=1 Tax=Punica granatum TaxID=22663 RepID=A0A2I0IMG2_PUNGR|nr:hypothetical protein CRG98_034387 [Punica granatum]
MRQNEKFIKLSSERIRSPTRPKRSFHLIFIQASINIQKWSPKHATKLRIYLVREVEGDSVNKKNKNKNFAGCWAAEGGLGRVGLLGVGLGRAELAVAGPGWMDTAGPGRMIGLGRCWTESNGWTVRAAGLGRHDRPGHYERSLRESELDRGRAVVSGVSWGFRKLELRVSPFFFVSYRSSL